MQKSSLESASFLVLPQHEKFNPEGPFVFAPFSLDLVNSSRKDFHVKGARILVGELV